MPKTAIDYTNTIVYMICCKDPTITDVWIGFTTNMTQVRYRHKTACNNPSDSKYDRYVNEFIRENGGFDNWSIIELDRASCIDANDAKKLTRKWIEEKQATLNKQKPILTTEERINYKKDSYKKNKEINAEELKEKSKKYYAENADSRKEYSREYKLKNKEVIKEKNKAYKLKKKTDKDTMVSITEV